MLEPSQNCAAGLGGSLAVLERELVKKSRSFTRYCLAPGRGTFLSCN